MTHFPPVPDKMNFILSVGLLLIVAAASATKKCNDVAIDAIEKEFEDLAKTKECSYVKHIGFEEGTATLDECEDRCEKDNNCKVVYAMVDGDLYTCDLFSDYCFEVDPDCSTCKVTRFDQISHCKDEVEQAQATTKTVSTGPTTPAMELGPCRDNKYHCDVGGFVCDCHPDSEGYDNDGDIDGWYKRTRHCVQLSNQCDQIQDCNDREDEEQSICNVNRTCPAGFFKCADNIQCIKYEENCNEQKECHDKSDEPADCIYERCPASQEKCSDGRKCVVKWTICSGKPEAECHDGLDEDHDYCLSHQCYYGYKKCESGDECFEKRKTCNGILDCKDHSDEKGCSSCDNGAQLCDVDEDGNGVCAQICDGLQLCVDGADETNCEERNRTASGEDVESGTGMLKTPITVILVSAVMAAFL